MRLHAHKAHHEDRREPERMKFYACGLSPARALKSYAAPPEAAHGDFSSPLHSKKWTAIVLALIFILALTACGETKENRGSIAEGTESCISHSDTGTAEAEPPRLEDTEIVRGIVSRVGTDQTYELTAEETKEIAAMIENSDWNTEGTADCANDCKFIIDGETYYYHSECGTLNDNLNDRCLTLIDAEKETINAALSRYVTLDIE